MKKLGERVKFQKCNLGIWKDQVDLFNYTRSTFSGVDVVLANAGITDQRNVFKDELEDDGKTLKELVYKSIDINLIGTFHSWIRFLICNV